MCTLAIYFQCTPEFPLVVAANRDEFYDRPTAPPAVIAEAPWVVAGTDLQAGGTWLGINGAGLVAGLLNRRTDAVPDPARRSRGLLCLDALRHWTVAAALAEAGADTGSRYNPFNLLLASHEAAYVVGNASGSMRVTPLPPGVHLLTNLELNDVECPRIAKSFRLFDALRATLREASGAAFRTALRDILADHSTPLDPRNARVPNNLCVHTARFGTRSSTLLLYAAARQAFHMWHADGPPCRVPYVDIPLPPPAVTGQGPPQTVPSRAMTGGER